MHAAHIAFEHGGGLRAAHFDNLTLRRNDGGGAGVGGADHVAAEFQSARLRLLKLLPHGVGAAEPGQVADVGQQGGVAGGFDQLVAKAVFVADVEGDFLTGHVKGLLRRAAALEVAQRHIDKAVHRLADRRQRLVFAKRYQMVFGVKLEALGILGIVVLQVDGGVQVVLAVVGQHRHAQRQRAAVALGRFGEHFDQAGFELAEKLRKGGFGQHDNLRVAGRNQLVVAAVGFGQAVGVELKLLLDIALHQADADRLPFAAGKADAAQHMAAGEQRQRGGGKQQPLAQNAVAHRQHQPAGQQYGGQRHQMNAAHRRETGQRTVVGDLRIADRAPAEAGQHPFAGKFRQRPQQRQYDAGLRPARQTVFFQQPKYCGRIQREKGRQQQGERHGVDFRHAADVVHRRVYPPKLAAVGHQPEPVARRNSPLRLQLGQAEQRRQQQRHQPEMVVGRESQRRGGGQRGEQQKIQPRLLPVAFECGKSVGHGAYSSFRLPVFSGSRCGMGESARSL